MSTLDLNGLWLIRHDPFNAGYLERWFEKPSRAGWREIHVPSAWQSVLGSNANGVAWYQRTLPDQANAWLENPRTRIRLRFESVATDCRAWVNGIEVGRHIGDYAPFEFDITDALQRTDSESPSLLIVRVDQVHAPRPVKGTVTESGHITKGFHDVLSLQHAGIWDSVSLRRAPARTVVPNGVSVLAYAASGRVGARVQLQGSAATPQRITYSITDPNGRAVAEGNHTLPPSGNVAELAAAVVSPRLWSPDSPALYTLVVTLTEDDGSPGSAAESHTLRFGFRTITTGGPGNSHILLNGTPICLRGILHWGHEPAHIAPAPTPDQVRDEFKHLRGLGFNCVCLCMWYPPEYFYDIADETGMLIWQEHPVWKSPMGDEHIPEYQRMYQEFFRRDRRHTSVILVSGSCEHEALNKALAAWWWKRAHEALPDRLLQVQTAFFNWTDPDQTDLYDEHVYDNSGRWVKFLGDVEARIKELKPKPFIMGETIISNAWPDTESYLAHLRNASPSVSSDPWWVTRGLKECEDFELEISDRFGGATLDRFRRQADRFGKQYRKFQAELFRMNPSNAGWVMNHIRDVPQCRCGFKDDFDAWRWAPEETLPWLCDAPILFRTPDHMRGVTGSAIDCMVGVSNFSGKPFGSPITITAGSQSHSVPLTVEPGAVAWVDLRVDLPPADRPTRLSVRAAANGIVGNAWDIWVLPKPLPAPEGLIRLSGLPFTDADREPEFEEKSYSAGWGLPCRTWGPTLPDTAALLPDATPWGHEAEIPAGTRVIVTHRLTRAIADFVVSGGRVVLLASSHRGGFGSKFVNLYGQVPLVIERDGDVWPVSTGESDWIVDLLHHDLTAGSARAVPTEDFGIHDAVEPIIRLVFTHDSGVPKRFDAAFAARVGRGLLVITTLDHSTNAGRYLLGRLACFAAMTNELPPADLDVKRWVVEG